MSQLFDKIKVGTSKRSTFDLSHNQVTTSDFGYLIPICYRDMLPNDDFVVKPDIFCRLAPLAVPVYGNIKCRVHHFFVPYRILYKEWDAFLTGSASNFSMPPFVAAQDFHEFLVKDPQYQTDAHNDVPYGTYCKLLTNLGLNPDAITFGVHSNADGFNVFPFLAYQRIYLDYYMDSNINNHEVQVRAFNQMFQNGGNVGVNDSYLDALLRIRKCCFKKDYFTTAKLNPQDGNPSKVGVDVADAALNSGFNFSGTNPIRYDASTGKVAAGSNVPSTANTKIGQFTIEALRAASSLQRYLERNNYVGSKIINRLLVHFGVSPTAERLDMAEYLGGSSFPIRIADVTSTNSVSAEDNVFTQGLGIQAGKGIGQGSGGSVRYHAKEHGVFMSIMSILPDTAYYQGISRFWFKGTSGDPLDYYTPEFENLGYQEVLNREVYVKTTGNGYQTYNPVGVFGYVPRYSEYKFQNDVLAGDFLGVQPRVGEDHFAPMDSWHLFRKLHYDDSNPLALNNNFVECDNHTSDWDRIFQFTDNDFDHFYFNIRCDVKATRDMVGFAEPTLDSTNNEGSGNQISLPYGGTRL